MRRPKVTRVLPPVAVVVVLAAVYELATLTHPVTVTAGSGPRPTQSVAVSTAVKACIEPGTRTAGVALIAAPATGGSGRAVLSRLGPASNPLDTVTESGKLTFTTVKPVPSPRRRAAPKPSSKPSSSPSSSPSASPSVTTVPASTTRGGVVVQASGAMARGLEVEQTTGAIPSAQCVTPSTDFWFVGPGQHTAGRIELYLMNPGGQAADVNVEINTDAGPLQGVTDTGIPVAPHSMVVQSLGKIVHGSRAVALHVRTSVGQVAAGVMETTGRGPGIAWLPAAQRPASRLIVPGLPGSAGARELYVAVPGTKDAHIRLTAVTTRGSYQPTQAGGLDIPAGSAVDITLPSLAGVPAALKLSANVPLTASAMVPGGPAGTPGLVTSATWPLIQQGVIAVNRSGRGDLSQLVLSAPGRAASARIWRGASGGSGASQVVHIRAGRSLVVQLGKVPGTSRGSAFAVVITPLPGSGPLYVARVMESSAAGGVLKSIFPVSTVPTSVRLPQVQQAFISTRR